ncbi:hypothetical protein M514_00350 [Trichuris suis]|uniref:Uncharacterized protein n=1 Tax=Trichuris suis TaxID=68888 RepID=A0A085NGM2_9BILA|nr:hypothetical protein M514_00350 [Trichuris suis]KHJ44048.1 hypothetical protein D918_05742 [Trichuris suis]
METSFKEATMNGILSSKSSSDQAGTNGFQQNGTTSTGQNGYEARRPKLKRVRLPFFSRARRNVKSIAVSAFWLPEFDSAQSICEQRLCGALRKRKASQCFADTCKEYDKWVFRRNAQPISEKNDVSHTGAKLRRLDETIGQNHIPPYDPSSTVLMTTSTPISTDTKVHGLDETIDKSQASTSSQNNTVSMATFSASTNNVGVPAASPFVFGTAPAFAPSSSVTQHNGSVKPFQFGVASPSTSFLPTGTFGSQSSTDLSLHTLSAPTDGSQIFAFSPASFSTTAKRSMLSRRRRR